MSTTTLTNADKDGKKQNELQEASSNTSESISDKGRQKRLRRRKFSWRKTEKQVSLFFSILLKAMLFTLLFGLIWLIYKGLTNDQFTLEEFEVPLAFSQGGYSGRVVAQQVQDRVSMIQERASALRKDSLQISTTSEPGMNVTVMGFGFSLESLIYYARSVFGKENKSIGGELTELDNDLRLHLRVTGKPLKTFTESLDHKNRSKALDTLLLQAAEHIMKQTDPHSLAIYQTSSNRLDDALATVRYNINTYHKELEWAYWTWGYILSKKQLYPEAEQKFKKAVEINPNLNFIWSALSGMQNMQRKRPEALKTLEKAIAIHSEHAGLWHSLAWTAVSNRKYDRGIEAIEKAIELNPKRWWYYSNRGEIMVQQMKFQKRVNPDTSFSKADTLAIVQTFRKAYETSEGNTNGAMALYQAYQFANEADSAWQMLELSVELDPNNGYSWHIMQVHSFKENKFLESIDYGQKAVDGFLKMAEHSENTEQVYKRQTALNYMAMAHYSLKDYDAATIAIKEAIAIDPNIPAPYTTLAEIYGFTNKRDQFYSALEMALEKGFPMNQLISMEPYTRFLHEERFRQLREKYLAKG